MASAGMGDPPVDSLPPTGAMIAIASRFAGSSARFPCAPKHECPKLLQPPRQMQSISN